MDISKLVSLALEEDLGPGDRTTEACVDPGIRAEARIVAREPLVVCGHEVAGEVFAQLGATWVPVAAQGERIDSGKTLATVHGPARALLSGERVALNFLMRLCGIATHTRTVVQQAPGIRVVDTRKTTPLLRSLERRAVRTGGGGNHRFALYDGILVKENHIRAAGGLEKAIRRARARAHHLLRVQVEVTSLEELEVVLGESVDAVLLDNMDDRMLAEAVALARGQAQRPVLLEASGGITPERLPRLAEVGVDLVSMGGLIHQARWVDLSMLLELK